MNAVLCLLSGHGDYPEFDCKECQNCKQNWQRLSKNWNFQNMWSYIRMVFMLQNQNWLSCPNGHLLNCQDSWKDSKDSVWKRSWSKESEFFGWSSWESEPNNTDSAINVPLQLVQEVSEKGFKTGKIDSPDATKLFQVCAINMWDDWVLEMDETEGLLPPSLDKSMFLSSRYNWKSRWVLTKWLVGLFWTMITNTLFHNLSCADYRW